MDTTYQTTCRRPSWLTVAQNDDLDTFYQKYIISTSTQSSSIEFRRCPSYNYLNTTKQMSQQKLDRNTINKPPTKPCVPDLSTCKRNQVNTSILDSERDTDVSTICSVKQLHSIMCSGWAVPPGWSTHRCERTSQPYFVHPETSRVTWTHPALPLHVAGIHIETLPKFWDVDVDDAGLYFVNHLLKTTSRELPSLDTIDQPQNTNEQVHFDKFHLCESINDAERKNDYWSPRDLVVRRRSTGDCMRREHSSTLNAHDCAESAAGKQKSRPKSDVSLDSGVSVGSHGLCRHISISIPSSLNSEGSSDVFDGNIARGGRTYSSAAITEKSSLFSVASLSSLLSSMWKGKDALFEKNALQETSKKLPSDSNGVVSGPFFHDSASNTFPRSICQSGAGCGKVCSKGRSSNSSSDHPETADLVSHDALVTAGLSSSI